MALPTPEEQEAYDKLSPEEKAKLAKEVEEKAKAELKNKQNLASLLLLLD